VTDTSKPTQIPARSNKRRRPMLAAARLTPGEYEVIRQAAYRRELSISAFIRATMLEAAKS
jgi:uncharacterized protein (DUF1778 family)